MVVDLGHRIKRGAAALGIPFEDYWAHVAAGEKWCWGCQDWHGRGAFSTRPGAIDGLSNECRASVAARSRLAMRRLALRRRQASLS